MKLQAHKTQPPIQHYHVTQPQHQVKIPHQVNTKIPHQVNTKIPQHQVSLEIWAQVKMAILPETLHLILLRLKEHDDARLAMMDRERKRLISSAQRRWWFPPFRGKRPG